MASNNTRTRDKQYEALRESYWRKYSCRTLFKFRELVARLYNNVRVSFLDTFNNKKRSHCPLSGITLESTLWSCSLLWFFFVFICCAFYIFNQKYLYYQHTELFKLRYVYLFASVYMFSYFYVSFIGYALQPGSLSH